VAVELLDRFLAQMELLQSVWMPVALMLAVVAIFIWRAMEWRYSATVEGLEHRLKLRDDTIAYYEKKGVALVTPTSSPEIPLQQSQRKAANPPPPPPSTANAERIFVGDTITAQYLGSIYTGKTHIQADKVAEAFKGMWTKIEGSVFVVTALDAFKTSMTLRIADFEDTEGPKWAYLVFPADRERLEILKKGDRITAIGKIRAFDNTELNLHDCELVKAT